jgi:hypothetical protein
MGERETSAGVILYVDSPSELRFGSAPFFECVEKNGAARKG